ncbi:MAG: phosphoglucosamine mutase, partial [Planctomycetaceae bacterium]|nr:phosphoglucosamine mutase [Planctomycetaceae bacterium]
LASWLFDILGCEPIILGENPSGEFIHTPEPTEENLRDVCQKVKEANVDVAFCQDPDADRVAVIDANGRYIGEEYTVALCLKHLLRTADSASKHPCKREKGPVVINCATSRMCEDIAAQYGVPLYRSAVGEANVVDMMLEKNAFFGGEGNGGPIDPKVGYVRDSFVGMALILDAMAATGKTVAQLADELPHYELVKRKTPADLSKVPEMLDKVAETFKHLPCSKQDGLRIDHGDSWVLLRGSNTEPIIRLFAEAPDRKTAEKLCYDVEEILR